MLHFTFKNVTTSKNITFFNVSEVKNNEKMKQKY